MPSVLALDVLTEDKDEDVVADFEGAVDAEAVTDPDAVSAPVDDALDVAAGDAVGALDADSAPVDDAVPVALGDEPAVAIDDAEATADELARLELEAD